jgi:hypothetical protein
VSTSVAGLFSREHNPAVFVLPGAYCWVVLPGAQSSSICRSISTSQASWSRREKRKKNTYSALAKELAVAPAMPVEQLVEPFIILGEEARQLLPELNNVGGGELDCFAVASPDTNSQNSVP